MLKKFKQWFGFPVVDNDISFVEEAIAEIAKKAPVKKKAVAKKAPVKKKAVAKKAPVKKKAK